MPRSAFRVLGTLDRRLQSYIVLEVSDHVLHAPEILMPGDFMNRSAVIPATGGALSLPETNANDATVKRD